MNNNITSFSGKYCYHWVFKNLEGGMLLWQIRSWFVKTAARNFYSLKVNKLSTRKRVLITSPRDVLIAEGQESSRTITEDLEDKNAANYTL